MTENTEALAPEAVSPVAETQNQATDAPESEVAQPHEEGQEPAKKELTAEEKLSREVAAKQRRIDRLTRERYQDRAQFDVERQQWQRPQEQPTDPNRQAGSEDIQRVIQTQAQQLASQMAEQARLGDRVQSILKAGAAIPGFNDACNAVDAELPFYVNGKPSPFLAEVLESEKPEALLKYLGDNPDVAAELDGLTQPQIARRLDRIEREMAPKAREASRAPRPLEPVRAAAATSGEPDPSKDAAKWIAWRNKQVSKS